MADNNMDLRRKGWTFSAAARQDAIEWMKQHHVRSIFENITAELLQEHPEDPLFFLMQLLDRKVSQEASWTTASSDDMHSMRPTTAQQQFMTESEKADLAEEIREEIKKIQENTKQQQEILANLEAEIAALESE